jgi:hypothetical protein
VAVSLFERIKSPQTETAATEETTKQKQQLIARLLDWLLNNWSRDTITARQICDFGPYPLRNDKTATSDLAQELVARGWLVSIKPRRHDSLKWKIAQKSASRPPQRIKIHPAHDTRAMRQD